MKAVMPRNFGDVGWRSASFLVFTCCGFVLLFPENCAVIKRRQASSGHARQDRRESERVPPKSARLLLGKV